VPTSRLDELESYAASDDLALRTHSVQTCCSWAMPWWSFWSKKVEDLGSKGNTYNMGQAWHASSQISSWKQYFEQHRFWTGSRVSRVCLSLSFNNWPTLQDQRLRLWYRRMYSLIQESSRAGEIRWQSLRSFPQHIWLAFKQQRKHQNGGKGVITAGGKMTAVSDVPMIS